MRRILVLAMLLVVNSLFGQWMPGQRSYSPSQVRPILDFQQKSAFMHFWRYADPKTGMIHASSNVRNQNLTIGGSGFGVMVMIVGAERGWISRDQAAKRIVKIVDFLDRAERFHGAWSHWVTREGKPVKFGKQIEAGDLVETSFMMMGLLAARNYFDGNDPAEVRIREMTEQFRETIEWNFYTGGSGQLYWLWESTNNTFNLPLKGYNEALITFIMAMGAPEKYAVSADVYRSGWLQNGKILRKNRLTYGYPMPLGAEHGGPMFLSHYTFLGLDPRQMMDQYADYFDNGVNHTMVNRHYCLYEAPKFHRYDALNWGLTACSGPAGKGYLARTPKHDDGVIAPTAAISSMPYTPFYSTQVLLNMQNNLKQMHTDGGFGDAYSLTDNWYFKDRIAIDQAPIVIMIENYRSGLLWNLLRNDPDISKGLERAGIGAPNFEEGFIRCRADVKTGLYDMIMHPDRECYEIEFWSAQEQRVEFLLTDSSGNTVQTDKTDYQHGCNVFQFKGDEVRLGGQYIIEMMVDKKLIDARKIILN